MEKSQQTFNKSEKEKKRKKKREEKQKKKEARKAVAKESGGGIQFAYVDSTKVFDILMVDLYFINKILDVGGVVVLDDCQFHGIKKLCRFLLVHPSFQLYHTHKMIKENTYKNYLSKIVKFFPKKRKIFNADLLKTDTALGINYHCISFKKIAEDNRDWKWYDSF